MTRPQLDHNQVLGFLPHRYPFLLVDRVLSIQWPESFSKSDQQRVEPGFAPVGTQVEAVKNVTLNEWYFEGHFPAQPLTPGVLLIETMAQAASFCVYPSFEGQHELLLGFECILVGVDNARFRRPVVPGDQLKIYAQLIKCREPLWVYETRIEVGSQKVADATIMANLRFKGNK